MNRLGLPVLTAVLVASVGFIAVAGTTLALLAYVRLGHNQVTNCQQIELVKSAERGTFLEAQHLTEASKGLTAEQKEQSVTFYRDALDRLKPRRC